jgi:hypothetical protein
MHQSDSFAYSMLSFFIFGLIVTTALTLYEMKVRQTRVIHTLVHKDLVFNFF